MMPIVAYWIPCSYFSPARRGLHLYTDAFIGHNSTNSVPFISSAITPSSAGCPMSPRYNTGWWNNFREWITSSPEPWGASREMLGPSSLLPAALPGSRRDCSHPGRQQRSFGFSLAWVWESENTKAQMRIAQRCVGYSAALMRVVA